MIQTALLVTFLVGALATNNNNGNNNKQFCGLPGSFTPATTDTVNTFNKVSANAAATALCTKLTASALRADAADCSVFTEGNKVGFVVQVTEGANHYECRAYVENQSQCRGNSGGGNHKRQFENVPDQCNQRFTKDDCHQGCIFVQPPNGAFEGDSCDCYWDVPGNLDGVPEDNVMNCPTGQQCCYNKPCESYVDSQDCYYQSGGVIDAETGTDSRCAWNSVDLQCSCRTPLEPVPPIVMLPSNAPFDCVCPYSTNITTTPTQCAALAQPSAQQLREIKFLSNRVFVIAKQAQSSAFVSQCPRDKVRVFFSFGARVHAVLFKVKSRLRQQAVQFVMEYHSNFVDFFFAPNEGGRFRAIAEEELTKEELEALTPASLEYEDAKTDSAATVALSAAALTAAGLAAI